MKEIFAVDSNCTMLVLVATSPKSQFRSPKSKHQVADHIDKLFENLGSERDARKTNALEDGLSGMTTAHRHVVHKDAVAS